MLLNTFAPPFKLVGGYFIAGICFLIASIPAFFAADFEAIAGLETAGFLHLFFVGFVMSVIIGALYQLTSVILEKPFSTIKGAVVNLALYCAGTASIGYGMISGETGFMHGGGMALFIALLFFTATYAASFMNGCKKSFAAFMLLASAAFLFVGVLLGFCLLMILSGTLPMDFMFALKFHVYFVLGFVFFIIVGVATAVVMVGGGIRVLNGAMSPGDLVLFTTYLRTTMKPLRDMAKYTGRIARATASGERVADLMAVKPDIVSPDNATVLDRVRGMIHFDHVHAAYEGRPVLHGVNLTVVPGEHVALVGPSGSGKSTLVSLVVRALDPTSGTVSLDGHSLDDLDLRFLRSQASVLHQEAVLLTGTIRENIRLGRPDASDEEVEAAARAAHAHDFITQMPDGYDTAVGERGGTLSGGQRQRIAIARALLRNSPIVILDEATTGLDPASTSAVLEAIDELVAGRTTLTVTHDPQAAMRADRVVWIQDGRIRLEGSPQELMESSADFRRWANSHLAESFALVGSGS